MNKVVSGLFTSSMQVDEALSRLSDLGYTKEEISVITRDTSVKLDQTKGDDIAAGLTTGGVIGGIVGLLTGLGALTIPGIGALFVAGPIAAALGLTGTIGTTAAGAMTGAMAGGLVGAFKELGIDEVKAKVIEDRVKNGDILVLVDTADDEADAAKEVFEETKAEHIYELELKS